MIWFKHFFTFESEFRQFSPIQCRLIIWYEIMYLFKDSSVHERLMNFHMDLDMFYGSFIVTSKHWFIIDNCHFAIKCPPPPKKKQNKKKTVGLRLPQSLCYQMFLRSIGYNLKSSDISITTRDTGYILCCWTAFHKKPRLISLTFRYCYFVPVHQSSIWMIKLHQNGRIQF